MNNLQINSISLSNIGGISELYINFSDGLNIICGENGIGKSTVLRAIAQSFFPYRATVSRRYSANKGSISTLINYNDSKINLDYDISKVFPSQQDALSYRFDTQEIIKNLIVIQPDRNFAYSAVESIRRDPKRSLWDYAKVTFDNYQFSILKDWFVNRAVFSNLDNSLSQSQIDNLNCAKEAIGLLDKSTEFHSIDPSSFNILLDTHGEKVFLEYLSSGYKSCVFLIWQIIAEIEIRFPESTESAKNFSGVILIDELDVHLHPIWQSKIANALCEIFPKSQIIVTTHSPHVLQTAEAKSVIAIQVDENNNTCIKNFNLNEYAFRGWSVEEILKDVMGVKDSISPLLDTTLSLIDQAIDEDKYLDAEILYSKLDKMLHPRSPLRKIYKLQLATIGVEINDQAHETGEAE